MHPLWPPHCVLASGLSPGSVKPRKRRAKQQRMPGSFIKEGTIIRLQRRKALVWGISDGRSGGKRVISAASLRAVKGKQNVGQREGGREEGFRLRESMSRGRGTEGTQQSSKQCSTKGQRRLNCRDCKMQKTGHTDSPSFNPHLNLWSSSQTLCQS